MPSPCMYYRQLLSSFKTQRKDTFSAVLIRDYAHSSPQGRIFQVEYAQEAVKQGSVVVGLVNKTHAVLVGLKV